ncbi:MAG: sigma factor-like helix-turn-helix DNA-binding protein [bacterium]
MPDEVSIFDRILEVEEAKKLRAFDIEEELSHLLACPKVKKARDREVLVARYGLNGDKPKTLEEIGRGLKVTRERIRQIEKSALKKISDYAKIEKRTLKSINIIKEQLNKVGGTVTSEDLTSLILGEDEVSPRLKNQLTFFIILSPNLILINETAILKSGVSANLDIKEIEKLVVLGTNVLFKENKPVEEKDFLKKLKQATEFSNLNDQELVASISLAKNIIRTDEGHLGLSNWRQINPKSIRDKTYYILRKHEKPLHFSDIAKHIESLEKNQKKVTKQAVHNELIRDKRFVLIGRGIYALREWGYQDGVVEDVIEEILIKAEKPLHKDQIIHEVLKKRIVKETTILLNLQKTRFTRVARATYTIKKK